MYDFDYNCILSSCESIIQHYASMYESDYDRSQDLMQELRVKVWNAIRDKYDSARGTVYDFAFGVIRLESKKHVLDAHKYRQSHFENTFGRYGDIDYSTTDPYVFPITTFDIFKSEFCAQLTEKQRVVFDVICEECDNFDFLYNSSSKLKLNKIISKAGFDRADCLLHYNVMKVKLYNYAIQHRMLVEVSTVTGTS